MLLINSSGDECNNPVLTSPLIFDNRFKDPKILKCIYEIVSVSSRLRPSYLIKILHNLFGPINTKPAVHYLTQMTKYMLTT